VTAGDSPRFLQPVHRSPDVDKSLSKPEKPLANWSNYERNHPRDERADSAGYYRIRVK
jgi:hypothetical protein